MRMDCFGPVKNHPRVFVGLGATFACLLACAAAASAGDQERPAASSSGGTGRLEGTVAVGPELSSRRMRFYFEPSPSQSATSSSKPERPVMRQEGLAFVPHVLAVPKGTTVDFPNGDAIFHNVFSLSKAAEFDLGRYPMGSTKSVRFDKPGIVKVFCHIHSDMSGVILVLDSPYFAVPDTRGQYAIPGLPPGEYTVVGWHERARPLRKTIRIQPGRTAVADFNIPITEPATSD
jgi:plastocyanin